MQRDKYIDAAKAIAIFLMLLGHWDTIWDTTVFYMIFSFHMPLFFFFSGYFYRKRSTYKLIMGDILVKHYALTATVGLLLVYLINGRHASYDYLVGVFVGCMGSFAPKFQIQETSAGPIWFLMALFWTRIYYNQLAKSIRSRVCLSIVCLILTLLFWQIGVRIINLPLCIGCAFTGLVFYDAGRYAGEIGMDNLKYGWIAAIVWVLAFKFSYLNMAQYVYTKFPLSILGAVCGTVTIYNIARHFKGKMLNVLSFIGKHTLVVVCTHTIAWIIHFYVVDIFCLERSKINIDLAYTLITIVLAGLWISYKTVTCKTIQA